MKTVRFNEAKTHLARLLDEIAKGETFSITRKGEPVALLIPFMSKTKRPPEETVRKLRELRKGITTGGVSIKEMIEEGRRF